MDILNRIDNGTLGFLAFILPTVGGLILLGVIAMYLNFRHQVAVKQQEDELKHDMIAKGMSAADIERVIHATAGASSAKAETPPDAEAGPGFARARLIATMAEHGVDAVGMEKILRVLAEYTDDELPAKVAVIGSLLEQGMEANDVERVIRAFQPTPKVAAEPQPTAFRE